MPDIIKSEKTELKTTDMDALSAVVEKIIGPTFAAMTDMVRQCAEALEHVAAQQKVQNDRLEAVERQTRLNTPVTQTQVKCMNAAMKERASVILSKREDNERGLFPQNDRKLVSKLSSVMKKHVMNRYGVGQLYEIPRHEYTVVMSMIEGWNDPLMVRNMVREWEAHNGNG